MCVWPRALLTFSGRNTDYLAIAPKDSQGIPRPWYNESDFDDCGPHLKFGIFARPLDGIEARGPPSANRSDSVSTNAGTCASLDDSSESSDIESTLPVQIPDLPGMALADPDISTWQDQIVYLDFDGAEDVIYEGPATVGPFDVPVFAIPMGMAGQENAIISEMLSELYRTVAGTGSVFTTVQPAEGLDYSTIYIGWEWFGLLRVWIAPEAGRVGGCGQSGQKRQRPCFQ